MAKKETENPPAPRGGRREVWGIALVAAWFVLSLSLFSYNWEDIGFLKAPPNDPPANFIGPVGAYAAYALFFVSGILAYALPFLALAFGLLLWVRRELFLRFRFFWSLMMLLSLMVLVELTPDWWTWLTKPERLNIPNAPGGVPGHYFTEHVLKHFLGAIGTLILALAVFGIATVLVFGRERIVTVLKFFHGMMGSAWQRLKDRRERDGTADLEGYETEPRAARYGNAPAAAEQKSRAGAEKPEKTRAEKPEKTARKSEALPPPVVISVEPEDEPLPTAPVIEEKPAEPAPPPPVRESKVAAAKPREAALPQEPASSVPPAGAQYPNYQLPPLTLLQDVEPGSGMVLVSDEATTGKVIVSTLADFGIDVQITNIERGPVVTCYELLPAPGVKVERISGLSNNLALSLKAKSVRVQAPIPGKGVVGVEVPNTKADLVTLRMLLESDAWRQSKAELPLVLGKDVGGNVLIADLATMPHLLIAGCTGSGKTVCMNSILAGLLMSRTPNQLHLMLVDPKIVEFTAYRRLPHLEGVRKEVITDPKKVSGALRWAISEMERRYKLFAKAGVRHILGYNTRPQARQPDLFGGEAPPPRADEYLPYIVIVVDELADLMMTAANEVEGYITRLAQLSRATGIHMILATQRPSVNVITGTIKANFPARIAFQVAQKVDSRTILDAMGADKLLGRGDMLFVPPGTSKMIRAQGCMTSDEDIRRISDFIRNQCPMPDPDEDEAPPRPVRTGMPPPSLPAASDAEGGAPLPAGGAAAPEEPARPRPPAGAPLSSFEDMLETGGGGGADEDLVEQSMQVIRETRRASTSALQRRLKIGYTRAARIMDLLEERGIVGPPRGSEAREILMDLDGDMVNGDGNGLESEGNP
jgi:S-DNA-T family DNA segregation ATPase FtsK/SpoIIIE